MNHLKNKLQFWAAVLLMFLIGLGVWYVMFYLQRPEISREGTLVYLEMERMVSI